MIVDIVKNNLDFKYNNMMFTKLLTKEKSGAYYNHNHDNNKFSCNTNITEKVK